MSRSRFVCEQCGSDNVKHSHGRSAMDLWRMLAGIYPMRCLDCQHRFRTDIL